MALLERYTRKTVVRVQAESTYGVNPGSWLDTHAVQVMGVPKHRIVRDLQNRDNLRGYFGSSDQLLASRMMEVTIRCELAAAGAAGSVPAWGPLLKACGAAQTVVGLNRAEYNPITDNQPSISMQYGIDGMIYTGRGGRGTAKLNLNAYEIPSIDFTFNLFDTAVSDNALTGTYASWQVPEVVTDGNLGVITMGGTLTAGVLSGGTVLVSRGIEFDLGNTVSHLKLLGGESIDITRRESMGKMLVGLSSTDEVTWRNDINANATTSLTFSHGSVAGKKILVHFPKMQRVDPQTEDYEGRVLMGTEMRFLPIAGNDEWKVVVR